MENICEICDELNDNKPHWDTTKIKDRTIIFDKALIVVAALGALTEGHLLLFTKQHYSSLAHLPQPLYNQLEKNLAFLRPYVQKKYKIAPIFFEHGPSEDEREGSCIMHAHLHCLPTTVLFTREVASQYPTKPVKKLEELADFKSTKHGYLFFENQIGQRYVVIPKKPFPSQYMRQVIAKGMGKPDEWDWALYPNYDIMKKTVKKLQVLGTQL
jgi:diadenosine tetraphosphate (Ap4A) HIT family hydrolase